MRNPFRKADANSNIVVTQEGAIFEVDAEGWDVRVIRSPRIPTCPHCKVAVSALPERRAEHVQACAVWG